MEVPKLPILFLSCLFLLHLLSSTLPPLTAAAELCNANDKKVLFQIKKSLRNPYVLISWTPDTDCCNWNNVKCDENTHRITSLAVQSDDNLSGHIPEAVGDLPYLKELIFHKLPNLVGPIPNSIINLENLQYLWLSWNNLTGPVPNFIGQMKNLTYINLSFNNFSGTIPPSLSLIPNLGYLDLSRNKLTGAIPDEFGSFKDDDFYLILSHNELSGPIPKSLGNVRFTKLDLSRNRLTGDASFLFGTNKALQEIYLSRNILAFDFSKLKFDPSLIWLDVNHNMIYGSIPESLTKLDQLQLFNVSYNRLCGKIPVSGRLQTRFDEYSYFHNRCLCGAPLPACK